MKWEGSLVNRIEENRQFCDEITVGTGVTEYLYSDRHAYEVIAVKDQRHVTIREYDHKPVKAGAMDNNWHLISNENNPTYEMTKRGPYWYKTVRVTSDILDEIENTTDEEKKFSCMLFLAHNDIDRDKLREKGKITRYHKMNISFGKAEYYYDYSF